MPKKQQKNSYFYFILDFKSRAAKNGRTLSMAQAAEEAGKEWAEMGPAERRPFEIKAKENKQHDNKVKKYTSNGEDVDLILKREKEERDCITAMNHAIENIVISSPSPPDIQFYVGYVNHYCFCTSLNKYLPAEISIVRFSLNTGVDLDDIFHVILDIGDLPIGYRLVALKQTEDNHRIPIPPHDDSDMNEISEKDIRKVLHSMLDFLRKNLSASDELPPVYFEPKNLSIAKDVFKNLVFDYGDSSTPEIKIYSLLQLFYQLRNAAKKDVFPITVAQDELDRDVYDYVQGISCKYHSVTDGHPYCSLSRCIRKIFIICDYTNPSFGIPLIAGKHVPKNACAEKLLSCPDFELDEDPDFSTDTWEVQSNPFRNGRKAASAADKEPVKTSLRPPKTTSFTQAYQEPKPSNSSSSTNYNVDFPALGGGAGLGSGGDSRPKPAAIGRGRGRILQHLSNNK